MKRLCGWLLVMMVLAVVVTLVSADQAQAGWRRWCYYPAPYVTYYHAPAVVAPPVVVAPPAVVAPPVRVRVYRPAVVVPPVVPAPPVYWWW